MMPLKEEWILCRKLLRQLEHEYRTDSEVYKLLAKHCIDVGGRLMDSGQPAVEKK